MESRMSHRIWSIRPEAMTVASEAGFPLERLVRPFAPIPILRSGDNMTVQT